MYTGSQVRRSVETVRMDETIADPMLQAQVECSLREWRQCLQDRKRSRAKQCQTMCPGWHNSTMHAFLRFIGLIPGRQSRISGICPQLLKASNRLLQSNGRRRLSAYYWD